MTDRPAPETPLDALLARVEHATEALLMLDYDGTLAPFRVDPAQAAPYPGVVEILDAIMAQNTTRIVLVTGRRADDLLPLLGTRQRPEIWGSHGWECLLPDGRHQLSPVPDAALRALADAEEGARHTNEWGARLERKPCALAVHWRGLPLDSLPRIREWVDHEWSPLCASAPLNWLEFDGGVELRVSGKTKGDVVLHLLAESGTDIPAAYLGDDMTDEDAFAAIRGKGLGVLVRPQNRLTAAQVWLRPPEELLAFLQRWERARGGAL